MPHRLDDGIATAGPSTGLPTSTEALAFCNQLSIGKITRIYNPIDNKQYQHKGPVVVGRFLPLRWSDLFGIVMCCFCWRRTNVIDPGGKNIKIENASKTAANKYSPAIMNFRAEGIESVFPHYRLQSTAEDCANSYAPLIKNAKNSDASIIRPSSTMSLCPFHIRYRIYR